MTSRRSERARATERPALSDRVAARRPVRVVGVFCAFLVVTAAAPPVPALAALDGPPSPALAGTIREMQRTLTEIRGHSFHAAVPVATLTQEQVRRFLLERLAKDYPDDKIAAEQKAYVHFGFLKAGDVLKSLFVGLLSEQAAGFYDPDEKRLFLVAGRSFPGIALVHELAHALQDQTFHVGRIIDRARDNDDMLLAVQSMIEGEAMTLASAYAARRPGHEDLPGMEESAGETAQPEVAQPRPVPEILQSNLMFPYTQGVTFANAVVAGGREAGMKTMDGMFLEPPESSEQILHPEKAREPRDRPSEFAAGMRSALADLWGGAGYREVKTNTLGEFNIAQLFGGRGDQRASEAASGWDADVYQIVERPGSGGDTAMLWLTVWDSPGDAEEFRDRAVEWLRSRHADASGWRAVATVRCPRAVFLLEGFAPELAQRMQETLEASLPSGVRLR